MQPSSTLRSSASAGSNYGAVNTSGHQQPVWIATEPWSNRPTFPKLQSNLSTDVLIVGAGITGISTAYECIKQGLRTTIIEAREVLSGESGRTSAHLSGVNGDPRFYELISLFGENGARHWFDSQQYALERVGAIAKAEGIDCEYRQLPGKIIVSVPKTDPGYDKANDLKKEFDALQQIGVRVQYTEEGKVGDAYVGAVIEAPKQATFHPTKYLNGVLKALKNNQFFDCYTHTRLESYKDLGDGVLVTTEGGHEIHANSLVLSTNVPLQEIQIIGKESYYRTYCVALRIPKGRYPDVLIYDNADPYVYVRKTAHPNPAYEFLIVGGEDHKVGMETTEGYLQTHYGNLVKWAQHHFPYVDPEPEYKWSGQVVEPNDQIAYIGRNTGNLKNVFIATGDSGNGLTHGVAAARLLTDLIVAGQDVKHLNAWEDLFAPSRKPQLGTIPDVIKENIPQQAAYSRYINVDVSDMEEIPVCSGAVMHAGISKLKKPLAVYKDGEGGVRVFSAICPHMKGVVTWNATEMSWDCPVHGSRFDGKTGRCIMGPAIHGLTPEDENAKMVAAGESG
ncbi:FAD dependent oxidoreductase-domain-containing protein [Kalaharituber pfeilii]|nr:FAD dependent oxidoreductase-domain-containing protein [Kalaharituber pfeilii]